MFENVINDFLAGGSFGIIAVMVGQALTCELTGGDGAQRTWRPVPEP